MGKAINNMILPWLFMINWVTAQTGIIAFNCTHPDVTSVEFDLRQRVTCPDFTEEVKENRLHVQLIQKREFRDVHAYAVKIMRTLHILPRGGNYVTHQWTQ